MKYFSNVTTLEDLKKEYRKAAFKLHPDRGGNELEFKAMINEYEKTFKTIQATEGNKATKEDVKAYKDIIDQLMRFEGIKIDIIGTWIWLEGNTYSVKEEIKKLGFLWSSKHKKWFYNGDSVKIRFRNKKNYNDLKNTYGCKSMKTEGKRTQTIA